MLKRIARLVKNVSEMKDEYCILVQIWSKLDKNLRLEMFKDFKLISRVQAFWMINKMLNIANY